MKPPAPVTTTRAFLDIWLGPFERREGFYQTFQRLARLGESPAGGRPLIWQRARRVVRLLVRRFAVKSLCDAGWRPKALRKPMVRPKKLSYTGRTGPFFITKASCWPISPPSS